jgi:hypothetical protein
MLDVNKKMGVYMLTIYFIHGKYNDIHLISSFVTKDLITTSFMQLRVFLVVSVDCNYF